MRAMRYVVLSSLLAAVGCGGMEQSAEQTQDVSPNGLASISEAKVTGQAGSGNVTYHGGPIMTGTTTVYFIYYGNWSGNSGTTILPDWAQHIGGSSYFNINTTYTNSAGTHVSNAVSYGGSTSVAYPYGTSLSDATIQQIVADAINSAALPKNTNALYFVLTSADVNETSGFCTQYCGWHTNGTIGGSTIKYSFVGNADRCISSCAGQSNGPNGNPGVDAMVSVMSHELEESVTDPLGNAWYDAAGYENGDKCAWTWGSYSTAANGTAYNITLGSRQYLIQQNWEKTAQVCTMHYP